MMRTFKRRLKKIFWALPLPGRLKEKMRIRYAEKKFAKEDMERDTFSVLDDTSLQKEFCQYVLEKPAKNYEGYKDYIKHETCKKPATLVAYYLTQFSPDEHNDKWWGKGTTEWNNVSKAVPQFVGHRQPRLPGEFGFYDLRIKDHMRRQIEVAKNYGIDVFSFYYYWFAGERILEKPLNMFLEDSSLDMPYMFCWANENWTKRFSGTDESVLIGMEPTVKNYQDFIHSVIPHFSDPRYFTIDGKIVLQIYRPGLVPQLEDVIHYWREQVRKICHKELYLIACQERDGKTNWIQKGFDAENEWMMESVKLYSKDITDQMHPLRKDFAGEIFDYADLVNKKKYFLKNNRHKKVYPAIMPSWDNTARRNNKGSIFYGSTPALYKKWLDDLIEEVKHRSDLDEPMIFVNAWNEWGEGTYMEPDHDYGFAYLEATWQAKNS